MRMIDLSGQKIGLWTVIGYSKIQKNRSRIYWECRCVCGNIKKVEASSLRQQTSKSCGCQRDKETSIRKTTHGHSPKSGWTKTYKTWASMLERCRNKNDMHHKKYYIDKGVNLCARWLKFENFLEDMGERPPNTSIDRINPFGDYEPSNCRWADSKTQGANRRKNYIKEMKNERISNYYKQSRCRATSK